MTALRYLFAAGSVAFVVAIVIQVLLAGAALFKMIDFLPHAALGWLLPLVPVLLVPIALGARADGDTAMLVVLLALDAFLQPGLAESRHDSTVIAALHPVNALLLFWLAIVVARRAVALAREPIPEPIEHVESAATPVDSPTRAGDE